MKLALAWNPNYKKYFLPLRLAKKNKMREKGKEKNPHRQKYTVFVYLGKTDHFIPLQ